MKIDLGCGPNKRKGYFGVDIHQYSGVDLIQDLNQPSWDIEDNSCTEIYANQVIEHIQDVKTFFLEIHRIAADGCKIIITTPHYSSRNSWADPTHVHHLALGFCEPFTGGYLTPQLQGFSILKERITFGGFFWTWPGRLICALLGYKIYEKRFCWIFPASSIRLELSCKKA